MYNVFNFDYDQCMDYLDDVIIAKYINLRVYKPNGDEFVNAKSTVLSELQWMCLAKQHEYIRTAIVCDCIDFIGLSKLINFDKMGTHKILLVALFTDYIPAKTSHYKLKCRDLVKKSIEQNHLGNLSKTEINELIAFTNYRMQHIELIDNINKLNTDKTALNQYKKFADEIAYEFPYPFTIKDYNNEYTG